MKKVRELPASPPHPYGVQAGELSDAELGGLARAGSVEALATLLEQTRPMLYSTAVGLLGNRAEAEDAVQDACLVALLRLDDVRDPTGRVFRIFADQTKSDLRALAACIRGSRQTLGRTEVAAIRAPVRVAGRTTILKLSSRLRPLSPIIWRSRWRSRFPIPLAA